MHSRTCPGVTYDICTNHYHKRQNYYDYSRPILTDAALCPNVKFAQTFVYNFDRWVHFKVWKFTFFALYSHNVLTYLGVCFLCLLLFYIVYVSCYKLIWARNAVGYRSISVIAVPQLPLLGSVTNYHATPRVICSRLMTHLFSRCTFSGLTVMHLKWLLS